MGMGWRIFENGVEVGRKESLPSPYFLFRNASVDNYDMQIMTSLLGYGACVRKSPRVILNKLKLKFKSCTTKYSPETLEIQKFHFLFTVS